VQQNYSKLSKASDSYKTLQGVISNDPEASYWAVSYKKYGENNLDNPNYNHAEVDRI